MQGAFLSTKYDEGIIVPKGGRESKLVKDELDKSEIKKLNIEII